jgi:hypothetical protein
MDEQQKKPEEDRIDLKGFGYNLSDMTDAVIFYEMEVMDKLVDVKWNIIAKPKVKLTKKK